MVSGDARIHSSGGDAILNLSDHLIRGDNFFEYNAARQQLEAAVDSAIFEVVLALIGERFPG